MDEQHRCAKEVWTGFASRGCSRRGVVQSDGKWWCKQHDPAAVARAREERRAEWERRLDSRLAATTRAALYPKLVEAAKAVVDTAFATHSDDRLGKAEISVDAYNKCAAVLAEAQMIDNNQETNDG